EAVQVVCRGLLDHVDRGHTRTPRPVATPRDERLDAWTWTLSEHFHRTVGQVAREASDAEHARLLARRAAKPHPLHAPSHLQPHPQDFHCASPRLTCERLLVTVRRR